MNEKYKAHYQSPIGLIEIIGTQDGILSLDFLDEGIAQGRTIPSCLEECVEQIDLYFKGKLRDFSVKLRPHGTEFQTRVWDQLCTIPFGETRSYRDIAALAGDPKACRAVGNANGKNKIAIIIPCHRVIGSDGRLTGYASGIWRKEWLLNHERASLSKE
jgi:methylated-DNA-[protein]-cysteine S-methyltransferase